MPDRVVVTCEHGGNRVPKEYEACFRGRRSAVDSHRGFDRGALVVARLLARELNAPLFYSTVTRLLVDLNRSRGHPRLFSEFVRETSPETRSRILDRYYRPYRREVERSIERVISEGDRVLHLGVHSFTPVWDGFLRNADLGLLYDPSRRPERGFAVSLQRVLDFRELRIRRNYPYRGSADGFTTDLRRLHPPSGYLGIEIELNQGSFDRRARLSEIAGSLADAIREVVLLGIR